MATATAADRPRTDAANVLQELGEPLFFPVSPAPLEPPAPRLATAVRVAARSLTVMQKEALIASSRTGRVWRLASDEGRYLDGHDFAPPPLAFLSAGMVASFMTEALALGRTRGIPLAGLELIKDNTYTMRGSARAGTMVGGAREVSLKAQLPGGDRTVLHSLICDAVGAASVSALMRAPVESRFSLTHNGTPVTLGRALPIEAPAEADPDALLAGASRGSGAAANVLVRTGELSPRTEATRTFAGGSLSETQDRILHLQVRASVRRDGLIEIRQLLFNPEGTMFHFLCGEDERAPDAETLVAAGIAFCFMTQFGRYAKIVGAPLKAYRVVQDIHLSSGGASRGTGRRGEALPVETHVHLWSGSDDAFARSALDMAEQTCFLHAFLKAALKPRVRVDTGFSSAAA